MMIASSTTIPSTMMNPNRLIVLIVTGHSGISQSAPRKVIGSPTMTQNATFMRRKSDSMMNTRMAPEMMLSCIISRRPPR